MGNKIVRIIGKRKNHENNLMDWKKCSEIPLMVLEKSKNTYRFGRTRRFYNSL